MADQSSANLFDIFRARFPKDAGAPFLILPDGHVFTYADLDSHAARIANLLTQLGVKPGDRVLAQVEKSPQAVFLYLAALRAGAVFLPLNTAYRADELDYFLADAEPTVVVGDPAAETLADLCKARHVPHHLTLDAGGAGSLTERSNATSSTFESIPRAASDLAVIL